MIIEHGAGYGLGLGFAALGGVLSTSYDCTWEDFFLFRMGEASLNWNGDCTSCVCFIWKTSHGGGHAVTVQGKS